MFLVFADMAQRRLKADEIDALLASMEEEEDIDDPCEREEEEDEYIEDVGGAVGGPTASGYQPSDSEEEGDHPDDSDTLLEPLTIADDETAAQEALHGPHAPIEEPPVTPVEERSRRRRRVDTGFLVSDVKYADFHTPGVEEFFLYIYSW